MHHRLGQHDKQQIDSQAGGESVHVNPAILQGLARQMNTATVGQGADLAWPALLRKCERGWNRATRSETARRRRRVAAMCRSRARGVAAARSGRFHAIST